MNFEDELDDEAVAAAKAEHVHRVRKNQTALEEREAKRWHEARLLMEGHVLADAAIAEESRFTVEEILIRAEREGWAIGHRLDGTLSRQLLIRRLMAVLERQVEVLEQSDMTDTGDRGSAMLGKLVTALDKIIEIQDQNGGRGEQSESKEMRDMRNKLARRIDSLKRK